MRMERRSQKDTFCISEVGRFQIATSSNLLDTKYEFYGFNDDLRETINY